MELCSRIKEAEAAVDAATEALKTAKSTLDQLYIERSKQQFGIEVGMHVCHRGKEYLVAAIRPDQWGSSKPWLYGYKLKNDGTPGSREHVIYDWEICARRRQEEIR